MLKSKLQFFSLAVVLGLLVSVNAQAEDTHVPPKPLNNAVYDAMVGDWQADTDMMGKKMHDKLKIHWDLNHQFIIMNLDATGIDNPQMKYEGLGVFGLDSKGNAKTWWFDSWGAETASVGKGTFSGNKLELSDSNEKFKETRSFEVKGNEMIMHAKGTISMGGKEMPFEQKTIYKKQ